MTKKSVPITTTIPAGKWLTEPEHKAFESYGYKCEIKRHPSLGHLCGYIHIPKSHKLWGKAYNELYEMGVDIDIHGGLTFADQDGDDWVFGFDCAHYGDFVPQTATMAFGSEVYRDMTYVTKETESLAKQLQALA
jgi:hypothetical protein